MKKTKSGCIKMMYRKYKGEELSNLKTNHIVSIIDGELHVRIPVTEHVANTFTKYDDPIIDLSYMLDLTQHMSTYDIVSLYLSTGEISSKTENLKIDIESESRLSPNDEYIVKKYEPYVKNILKHYSYLSDHQGVIIPEDVVFFEERCKMLLSIYYKNRIV